jgi:hypothetical protein
MIQRQPQRGPLVQQGEAGETIARPDQQGDASAVVPIALEPRIGEPALGIELAVRAADPREFRKSYL